ncbi:efflux RND transporter periplasmic adaptor subunit [Phytobacter sp. V91]|uniref:efflux RND transporter periplasmic adaptor subunit n=1 Tax=Phytobacter sp. V91 TaxID=3369425 RepID=UPI003F5D8F3F
MTHTLTAVLRNLLSNLRQKCQGSGLILASLLAFSPLFIAILLHSCQQPVDDEMVAPRPVKYLVVPPPSSRDAGLRVGEIHAHDEVALGFRTGGRIISRTVDIGDRVQAGQLLATLESDTSQNQRLSAQADLESARAAEQVAAVNLRRMKQLMPSGAISLSALDSAQAEWQAAASKRKSAQASLKIADENLSWSRLIAPSDGVITAVNASVGQVVSAAEQVATLAAGDSRDAVFAVASPDDMPTDPGTPFTVSLLSSAAVRAQAIFRDISPQADSKTRTWRVRLTLISPPPALALGASVQAAFSTRLPPVIALPASSLTRDAGKPAVFVLDKPGLQLALRPVTLAGYSATDIFIADGVQPGDKVVIAGVSKLRAGEKVSIGEDE